MILAPLGGFSPRSALYSNTTGSNNTANGFQALYSNTTGNTNTANGINGVTASGGVQVYVNANGQLGTLTSSARFKYDIHNLGATSEKMMDLRPVSFRYKEAAQDGSHPIQYGLIAEEVAKVYPDMVQYDKEGKPFTIYYQQLTPMMLNELQKSHQEMCDLKATHQAEIAELKSEMAELKQMVQKQGTGAWSPQANSRSVLFNALVLAACIAGTFFVASRSRQAR